VSTKPAAGHYWESLKQQDYDRLIQSTENKAGEFSEDPRIRAIIGQAKTTFDLKALIAQGGVVVLRLPKGQLGQKTTLLGSLFLAYLLSLEGRGLFPFHVFIDGVHHFDTPIVRHLLESRYDVTVTHRYLGQLTEELKVALLGSADRRVIFRTGVEDGAFLERTMPHDNTRPSLHMLGNGQMMTVEGNTIEWHDRHRPLRRGNRRRLNKLVSQSKRRYGRDLGAKERT
jgi:hypothetical protein